MTFADRYRIERELGLESRYRRLLERVGLPKEWRR